jgi:hypothetical protein
MRRITLTIDEPELDHILNLLGEAAEQLSTLGRDDNAAYLRTIAADLTRQRDTQRGRPGLNPDEVP